MMIIKNVKINGSLVDENIKLKGEHLCFRHCPLELTMSCPKINALSDKKITDFPFILDGAQELIVRKSYNEDLEQYEMVTETKSFSVTKCKRYEDGIKNTRI